MGATAETANHTLATTVKTKLVISKAKARGSECKLALQNSLSFSSLVYLNVTFVPTVPHCYGLPSVFPSHTKSIKHGLIIKVQTIFVNVSAVDPVAFGPGQEVFLCIGSTKDHDIKGFSHQCSVASVGTVSISSLCSPSSFIFCCMSVMIITSSS